MLQLPQGSRGFKVGSSEPELINHVTDGGNEARLRYPNRKFHTYPITFLSNSSQALLKESAFERMGWGVQARTLIQPCPLLSATPNQHPIPGWEHSSAYYKGWLYPSLPKRYLSHSSGTLGGCHGDMEWLCSPALNYGSAPTEELST